MNVRVLPPMLRLVSPTELAERIAAERRGTPFLVYVDSARCQRIVDLAPLGDSASIGRDPDSDVRLEWDAEVSRAHAVLQRVAGAWTIVDDGLSRNGSFVNGHRVRGRRRLDDGDFITVGHTLLVYVATEGEVRTTVTSKAGTPPELTPALQRVLDALCRPTLEGPVPVVASNREIAAELFLSIETVKSHMHALFELFGVPHMPQNRKRAELVKRAFERGAVSA
ncbi:MAG TPA: FHA domain-containing protein [Solirubrobacteraceae bacterium]|nr:FHA domain-containing protein [Solirubrobacteraceae bacterium]